MKPDSQAWQSLSEVKKLIDTIKPYTYLVEVKLLTLIRLCEYLSSEGIPGDFVECGVYKGGSAAVLSRHLGLRRHLWLYDSFEGMPETSANDGEIAKEWIGGCVASVEDVREVMTAVSTRPERYTIRKGWFRDTFIDTRPSQVALLHCDCDWYESVTLVLETFYPLVAVGGCVILDDFGFWEGCRAAFYDFCIRHGEKPLLERVERDQAFWIKGRTSNRILIPNLLDTHERENLEKQQFQVVLGELDRAQRELTRIGKQNETEKARRIDNGEVSLGSWPKEGTPGMISAEERAYLAQFAGTEYSGEGAIVDLGCWLGASTIALVRGLRENPWANLRTSVVHAYDRFVWEAWMDQFVAQTQLKGRYRPGDSFYEECVSQTLPWRDSIEFHPGDLSVLGWNSGPIEFLFIDAMKSWALANSILNNFFSALIPGRSIVVHQDFAHFGTHWIHLIMYRLRSFFEPVHDIPHSWSMVFRYREAMPAGMLVESYSPASFSTEELEAAFEYSSSIVAFEKQPQIVGAKVMALLEQGDVYRAWEELEHAKAANLCYADLHLPLGLWFPAMIMNGFENEHKANQAMRRELEDTRASLQRAQERIEAVQNTKLGKLKKSWSQFRQRIRSAGSK